MLVMDTGVSLLFWARSISARSPYLPFVDSFTFSPSLSSFLAVSRNPSLFPSILLGFTFVEYHPSFVLSSHELTYAVKSLLLSADALYQPRLLQHGHQLLQIPLRQILTSRYAGNGHWRLFAVLGEINQCA